MSSAISLSASRRSSRSASLLSMINLVCTAGAAASFSFISANSRFSSSFSDARSLISRICSWITAFISACSFSTALALASMVMDRHDWPKRRHAVDSCTCSAEFESAKIMCSMLLPPRPFCSIIVNFDSRNGMCCDPSARHLTTSASLVSDRLILMPSLKALPVAPVFFMPSDPARSTRLSDANVLVFSSDQVTCMMSSACDREDWSFMLVDAVARCLQPASYICIAWS
mmetsp:Transcript_11790/g.38806  ORF Transcript_11790/g.38806 Transcript_11790/m.38806 type:complete len:229 (-) Transcript_11790:649-1335(-)